MAGGRRLPGRFPGRWSLRRTPRGTRRRGSGDSAPWLGAGRPRQTSQRLPAATVKPAIVAAGPSSVVPARAAMDTARRLLITWQSIAVRTLPARWVTRPR